MKHTTRNEVADMIFEATAKLRKDLTDTLIELANTAKVRREKDIVATAQLVDYTADYLKQYVRDMLANRPSVAEAVESSGSGDYARGYAAALTLATDGGPQLYRSNEWLEKQASYKLGHSQGFELGQKMGYADGHATALAKVIDLLNDTPIRVPRSMVAKAIKELAL